MSDEDEILRNMSAFVGSNATRDSIFSDYIVRTKRDKVYDADVSATGSLKKAN
jgi:hypothetical protein